MCLIGEYLTGIVFGQCKTCSEVEFNIEIDHDKE